MRNQLIPSAYSYDVTDDSTLPVTVADVKSLGRIDGTDEDSLIASFILEATLHAEQFIGRSLLERTYTLLIDQLSGYSLTAISRIFGNQSDIYLPKGKIQSVTSVKVYDDSDNATAYNNYQLDSENGRIVLKDGTYWQSAQRPVAAIEVIYVAGYGSSPDDIPYDLRMIIRRHALKLYENRESCADMLKIIKAELKPFKVRSVVTYLGVNRYNLSVPGRGL